MQGLWGLCFDYDNDDDDDDEEEEEEKIVDV